MPVFYRNRCNILNLEMTKKRVSTIITAKVPLSAREKAPRVRAAKHRTEPVSTQPDLRDDVATIAYGYWESRGRQDGDPVEDWFRAEEEFRRSADVGTQSADVLTRSATA